MWVITWDLNKNLEYSSLEVDDIKEQKAATYVCKGLSQKLNYIVTQDKFYDLQFMSPFNFVTTGKREPIKHMINSVNELKVGRDKSTYLGIGRMSSIYKSHSFQTLIYWRDIFALKF